MLELLTILEAESFHDFRHAIGRAEVAHEVVLEADIETRGAWIALPSATSAKLAIDAARFVALGADDVKAAPLSDARPELNVGAAASHVCRNGHRPSLPGATDDLRFLAMIF